MNLKISLAIGALAAITAAFGLIQSPRTVILEWDYPTNALSTNLTFVLRATNNPGVPLTNWPVITNISGTNLTWKLLVIPGQQFYVITASNIWGESDFSNVALTQPVATPPSNLIIRIQ